MSLREYLEDNSSSHETDFLHEKLLEDFTSRMETFMEISTDSSNIFREVRLLYEGNEIGRVDRVIIHNDNLYLIEGKVIRGKPHLRKSSLKNIRGELNFQLQIAYNFFLEEYNVASQRIGLFRYTGARKMHIYEVPPYIEDLMKTKISQNQTLIYQ